MRWASWVTLASLFAACPAREGPAVQAGPFACTADTDCELVELGVCDSCNGGWALSVAKGSAAKVKHLADAPVPDPRGCSELGCKLVPICEAGRCALRNGPVVWENFKRLGVQHCGTDADCVLAPSGNRDAPVRALSRKIADAASAACGAPLCGACDAGCSAPDLAVWAARCELSGTAGRCVATPRAPPSEQQEPR